MGRARVASLRLWLQSTSLLAVLAGYSVLLLINQRFADWQRLQAFQQTKDQILSSLGSQTGGPARLNQRLKNATPFGLNAVVTSGLPSDQVGLVTAETHGDKHWLVGVVPLNLVDGTRVYLSIRQDVTISVQQENLSFWLLVIAAGTSSLFTSALLRLVLHRGLVQPLDDFSALLGGISVPPTPGEAIRVDEQPQELQPIAQAFNAMQQRLWASWDRERMFADGVAHELRTPITLITGHAQSLLRQGPPERLNRSLQLIRTEAERMRSLVSDLLDLARQDAQRLNLQKKPISADDALLELYERLSFKAAGRLCLDPGPECAPERPEGIGDPDRIQQCLTALVDNALRYSPGGTRITLGSSSTEQGDLILFVRDQGPGVPAEERERIFERFARGSAALERDIRGSGIGLAVVKLLMEAMGGNVAVCDAPGGGAEFQLHLRAFRVSVRPPST